MEILDQVGANTSVKATVTCYDGNTGEQKWREETEIGLARSEFPWVWVIIAGLGLAAFAIWAGLWMHLLLVSGLVFTAGHNLVLDRSFKTVPADVNWYVGLTSGTPTLAAGDTMASHAGWTEVTAYSNGTRPAWTPGTISSGSVNNSGSLATFNMNSAYTTGGFFLTTNSTKGGTTGTAYGGASFTNRSGDSPDVITIQATLSQS